ncbi:MAG TPA: hypothetical protein VGI64_17275 [Streptosporangiaceae bacterium]
MAATDATAPRPADGQRPKVILHVGEPKTGTTFLQQVMWRNRPALAAQGVTLPGHHPQDHFRASQDLRGIEKRADDPAGSWDGEWDILAGQARQAGRVSVISHELFAAVDADQADRAVRSLQPAQVHVVLTVRDMASLLPAEWQETVKHRSTRGWEDWLADVIDVESVAADRRQFWFWRVHDTLAVLRLWARQLPPEQVHVITVPPRGSGDGLLWRRFAGLLEVDPDSVETSLARPNASLGLPEIEFLRRLNEALGDEMPGWYYMWNIKEGIAHRSLAARPRHGRLVLPADRDAWAKDTAEALVSGLAQAGYDIIGELPELQPEQSTEPPASPAGQRPEDILDAAVESVAALFLNQYHRENRAARQRSARSEQRGLVGRIEAAVGRSPRVKRIVRDLSSRSPAVRRLRVATLRAFERSRTRGRP